MVVTEIGKRGTIYRYNKLKQPARAVSNRCIRTHKLLSLSPPMAVVKCMLKDLLHSKSEILKILPSNDIYQYEHDKHIY
jgi:hypothetical protein